MLTLFAVAMSQNQQMKQKTRNEKRLTIKKRVKYAQTAPAVGGDRKRATIQELIEVGWQQQLRIACAGSSTGWPDWSTTVGRNAP